MFDPDSLSGDQYDQILSREVSQQERLEAFLQFRPLLTMYADFTQGFYSISATEYRDIPSVFFEGLRIFQRVRDSFTKKP